VTFFVVGVSHKTAPIGLREQLGVTPAELVSRAAELKSRSELAEIVVLSTCNRFEIYATSAHPGSRTSSLLRSFCSASCDFSSHTYCYENFEAARHLFRVAGGLNSMVLGETEITGQVKKAYEVARAARLTGGILNRTFQKAFQVVKEIRTRTGIGRGATSVGGVAVQLAERIFPHDISRLSVMIVGAGCMGEACAHHLAKMGPRSILVSNRTFDRAVELAGKIGGLPVPFEDWLPAMADADIVMIATGRPKTLLHPAEVERVMVIRQNRPLVLIDISVPRNIDAGVQHLNNVYLYNIDDLEAIVAENVRHRAHDLTLCDRIIEARAAALIEKLNSQHERHCELDLAFQCAWVSEPAVAVGGWR
jgi:glutamyl-tRNA reductase